MVAALVALLVLGQLEITAEQQLDRARTCHGVLDFDCAERALTAVRRHLEGLDPDLKKEALRLSAEIALSRGRMTEAEPFLVGLLVLTPRFAPRPGAWPPAWLEALDRARARVPDQSPPRIALFPMPSTVTPGTALLARARIEDETGVDRAEVLIGDAPLVMTSSGGSSYAAIVPAEWVKLPMVALVVRATDLYGHQTRTATVFVPVAELQALGSTPGETPAGGPAWWVWALAAAAVVGGALTVALVATSGDDLGPVRAKIEWP